MLQQVHLKVTRLKVSMGVEKVRIPRYPHSETDATARIWLRFNKDFEQ